MGGLAGRVMAHYSAGYGETLPGCDQREPWSVRFG
jgi:hypothetical protein